MLRRFLTVGAVAAFALGAAAPSAQRSIPRTADGHPDLQGTYDLGTLTPLERAAGSPAVLSEAEAAKLERQLPRDMQIGALPSRGDRTRPPVGGDGTNGPEGDV